MSALLHVDNALALASRVIRSATQLGAADVASRVRAARAGVESDRDRARASRAAIATQRDARNAALAHLSAIFHAGSRALAALFGAQHAIVLVGGRALSVVERARFRLRALAALDDDTRVTTARVEHVLDAALAHHDAVVDDYLRAVSVVLHDEERAILSSQHLRQLLEHARDELLARAPRGHTEARALRALTLRTRRPKWTIEEETRAST